MKRHVVAVAIVAVLLSSSLAETRTWTSRSGKFSTEAELLDYDEGQVQLLKSDGETIKVPLVALCKKDREFIEEKYPGVEVEQIRPGANYREWTSKNGRFKIVAEFLKYSNGKLYLQKMDGEEISVPKEALCATDRKWLIAELRRARAQGTGSGRRSSGPRQPVGELGPQEVAMKLMPLDPPGATGGGRGNPVVSHLLRMTDPQTFYMRLGQGPDPRAAEFQRIVQKEPKYQSPAPFRGVARLGSHQYAFALDIAGGAAGYNQLYFDLNHNGDLTDDKPISALVANRVSSSSAQSQFPRVDLQLDADGTQVDYAFLMSTFGRRSGASSYVSITLYAGAVREGYIGKGTKRTHVVLLDRNSNGRFDDRVRMSSSGGRMRSSLGDLLLVNPNPNNRASSDPTMSPDCYLVAKTVCIDKSFYRMEVSPAGDQLKLTPAEIEVGHVTSSNPMYRAVVYNDDFGVLTIGGTKSQKIPLPAGEWKVAKYTIDASALMGGARTSVEAAFGSNCEPVTVSKGETAELPFGMPYKAVVTGRKQGPNKVYLSLAIVGVGGERCTSLYSRGKRPPAPQFTITSSTGDVVQQGKFEYG